MSNTKQPREIGKISLTIEIAEYELPDGRICMNLQTSKDERNVDELSNVAVVYARFIKDKQFDMIEKCSEVFTSFLESEEMLEGVVDRSGPDSGRPVSQLIMESARLLSNKKKGGR